MTHAEQRAKLVEMICSSAHPEWEMLSPTAKHYLRKTFSNAIAALYGHYTINAVEVTEEERAEALNHWAKFGGTKAAAYDLTHPTLGLILRGRIEPRKEPL